MSLNSTITTDEFVPGKKLLVHLSENGHSFEFECDGSTPVEAIQRSVESLSGVQFVDQLLLCGKILLDTQHQLSYYELPQDGREVFLYNKAKLHADSPRPPPENIEIPNASIPPPPSPTRNTHPLDDASDPALKALASYEKQFRYHFQYANAFYTSTQAKFELCKRLLREQQVQERALETARGNLEFIFRKLNKRYLEFYRCFSQQHRVHSELLGNFERDVERLQSLRLHPAVQSEGRKCLLDLVKVDDLRKWVEICLSSHRQFECKVSQLRKSFGELKGRVDNVFSGMSSAGTKELEALITDHQKILTTQKSIMQCLSKDVNTVKKQVDDCLNRRLSSSVRPHDAVSALGPMYEDHEKNQLPKVLQYDNIIAKLLDKCKGKKDSMNCLVHVSMQKVKSAQFSIKDLMNQLHAFEEVMGHQEKEFENLKFVNGVGHAYRACLAEVIRRKSYLKLYMGLAGQMAEMLAAEREAEISRREGFQKAWSKYIPPDILAAMGLYDTPSQCDVNMAPFDTNLIHINVADVDRYAPQAVVGLLLKCDKNKLPKSSLATSSGSCYINESEETSLGDHLKYNCEGFLEGYESVEIAGTSKMEVENARLKAELASAIAVICTFNAGIGYDSFDGGELNEMLKAVKEKTAEALQSKDEYVKHLQSMLNTKQVQCSSYEKRIQELEQRLEEQYVQGQKNSAKDVSESVVSAFKADGYTEGLFGDVETQMRCISTVSMESSSPFDPKLDPVGQTSKHREGGDENMADLSGTMNMQSVDFAHNYMDASMQEIYRDEQQVIGDNGSHQVGSENNIQVSNKDTVRAEIGLESKIKDSIVLDLQNPLADKSNQLTETESQLKAAMEENSSLRRELEVSRNLLGESQMNCVHLENCLHEAREEARTNLCTADRRASEYATARSTALKMRSLFERFRSCVTTQVGVTSFADVLRSLALSLASSATEDEDDGTAEFRASIKVLADKVCRLRAEIVSRTEAALEEKTEQIKSLNSKLQLEKQASKEKISFLRLELDELACFVPNSAGHYEAIHQTSSSYYLSSESVALFTEQYAGKRPPYIIGQIVHIEHRTARRPAISRVEIEAFSTSSAVPADVSNPYGLPIGREYLVVTVAMLPGTIRLVPS